MDERRRRRARQIALEGRGADEGASLRDKLRANLIDRNALGLCAFVRYAPAENALRDHIKGHNFLWFDKAIDRGDSSKTIKGIAHWGAHACFLAALAMRAPQVKDLPFLGVLSEYAMDPSPHTRFEVIKYQVASRDPLCRFFQRVVRDRPSKWAADLTKYALVKSITLDDKITYVRLQKVIVPWALKGQLCA